LALVLPAHDEQRRLPAALEAIHAFIARQAYETEVIVVENGSRDDTLAVARGLCARYPELSVLHEPAAGKGGAVRRGMLESTADYRFMCDVDFSMPVEQVARFLPPALSGADVAIGSREVAGSIVRDKPHRRLVGRVFNFMIRRLLLPGIRDTQCGFKCFTRSAASAIFPRLTIPGFAFDVEALYVARRLGLRVEEVAITWTADADSRVRVARDAVRMLRDVLSIRRNGRGGVYDRPPPLAS
jgi:dolichyl-phosphate beta-glucosyltransferase